MGPNSADIVRVYTREASGEIENNTLDPSADAVVVVDVEAGGTVLGNGAQWQLGIVVKDLTADSVIPFTLTPTTAVSGSLSSAPWTTQSERFHYTIPAANLATHKGSLCQVYAYLLIGTNAANYDASFVESQPFLVLP
ncbi:MAG TPA: hypothetical protein VMU95_29680 [Trebonia sp.]|nr:hypothetical protein [Trebonia sp.]